METLAVLIDFENLATGTRREDLGTFDVNAVFRRLKDKGRIVVARAYADWGRYAKHKQTLLEQGVTMVELASHGGPTKNRADIALVVDAMELAFTRPHISTFVVLSGDSDFTPLIFRLKEFNKRVIGCGTRKSTSRLIVYACDEFIFYENIIRNTKTDVTKPHRQEPAAKPQRAAGPPPLSEKGLEEGEAFELLVETLEGLLTDDPDPQLASMVKDSMRRKEPSFNERDLGFSGFGRFLEAAKKRGLIRLIHDERANSSRVDLSSRQQEATEEPTAAEKSRDPEDKPPDLRHAFALLMETVEGMQADDPNPVPAGQVKQAMLRHEPSFNERDHGFAGFGRFLEAAHARNLVALVRDHRSGGYRVDFFSPGEQLSPTDDDAVPPVADAARQEPAAREE